MVVPSLKSHVLSELLPSEWLAMKCQMRVQMDGWWRVRGLERQSFTLLNPKELCFIGSITTYGYFNVASSFMVTVLFIVELSCESELINMLKWLYTFYILNQYSGIWGFRNRTAFWMSYFWAWSSIDMLNTWWIFIIFIYQLLVNS